MTIPLLTAYRLHKEDISSGIRGYFLMSTAPINVEDSPREIPQAYQPGMAPDDMAHEVAGFLATSDHPEIIIAIHGYNTEESVAQVWGKEIYEYINDSKNSVSKQKDTIFLAYNWPSESFLSGSILKKIASASKASPVLLNTFRGWIIVTLIALLSLAWVLGKNLNGISLIIFLFIAALLALLMGAISSIILMRVIAYFRDSYRATNYGVPDLVEIIRHLDNKITELDSENNFKDRKSRRVKLSFIGHSMGGFVVTNVVRILSDVFDTTSIEPMYRQEDGNEKAPTPFIGNVFSLGRLVLVSPDIPIESIIPGRSNFLRSSLRRFEESYLFSNEGDMVLRVLSTAANYLSFSASTDDRSFRLGNITLDHSIKGGIVNLDEDRIFIDSSSYPFLEHLYIGSNDRQKSLYELKFALEKNPIAELFTYFDCTNYSENGRNLVSRALNRITLNFFDCAWLLVWDYIITKKIDVHAGYFKGDFGRKAIYGLAFLGFEEFLKSLDESSISNLNLSRQEKLNMLFKLSDQCEKKGIQVLISPRQYKRLEVELESTKIVNEN
jgi:pimeloyl-ACP methyl ester carboxylesterase